MNEIFKLTGWRILVWCSEVKIKNHKNYGRVKGLGV